MKKKGLLEEDNKVKISDKSIVVSSFEGLRDIFKDVKNHKEKNPSYYDNNKSDGMTVDKNGNIKFHGKKGLKIMEKRKEDGLSITNIIEPRLNTRKENKKGGMLDEDRYGMESGGPLVGNQKEIDANNDGEITGEDFKLLQKAEGGEIDDQMLMVMTPPMESEMESDDDMEDNYTRFIMEEALSEEEEDMLTSKLEQDEELSMLFDKIIDVAQEFAGSGPVNGPGSGVSDSIPARLSDGEFVFTAKAVEEIGEDSLMSMMKDAEAKADERQGLAEGGMPEDNNVNVQADALLGMDMSSDPTQEAINENMIKYQPYVRS